MGAASVAVDPALYNNGAPGISSQPREDVGRIGEGPAENDRQKSASC